MVFAEEKIKLLYVEDDEGTRTMLGRLLNQKYPDLAVFVAGNGQEGLMLFHEHHPDLIVTDISMPIMSGLEMSNEIRKTDTDAIIIAVTAHTDSDFTSQSAQLGICHCVMKPISFKEFFSVIENSVATLSERRGSQLQ